MQTKEKANVQNKIIIHRLFDRIYQTRYSQNFVANSLFISFIKLYYYFYYREQLMNEISEQEKQSWMLKEEQKTVKDLVQTSAKQLNMWQDVIK